MGLGISGMNSKENSGGIVLSYTNLRKVALVYIALPMLCFFLGWLKWYWAALGCVALIVCFLASNENSRLNRLFVKKGTSETSVSELEDRKLTISKKALIAIVLCSLIYLILCGVGRLWAQSGDLAWRNAIFRDIIVHDWPVYYNKFDGALCYYIGVWLPAAIPGKIVYLLSGNSEAAFTTGNIVFLIYYTFGLTIIFLLLILYFQAEKAKQILLIVAGFILFSGMDILGVFVIEPDFVYRDMHLEWWSGFQYSSFTTCLCWVYNQALIPWLCILLLLFEKKISSFVFIGMACLFCGPFPFIGYLIYAVTLGFKRLIEMLKAKKGKQFAGEAFSISNICAALFVFPFIGSYLTSNTLMSESGAESSVAYFLTWDSGIFLVYAIFVVFEFGIYALLIFKQNIKNSLFYVTVLQLLVYPFLNVGVNSDLTMRASIPAIFMLFILCYKYLFTNTAIIPVKEKELARMSKSDRFIARTNIVYMTLILCLIIGTVTPGFEFARGIKQVGERGINDRETDYIVTLDQDSCPDPHFTKWPPTNFVSVEYDDVLFFKYFAKDRSTSL